MPAATLAGPLPLGVARSSMGDSHPPAGGFPPSAVGCRGPSPAAHAIFPGIRWMAPKENLWFTAAYDLIGTLLAATG